MFAAIYTRTVAALSLASNGLWHQLPSLVVEELAGYVQPLTLGVPRMILRAGRFTGGYHCTAHGDEVYVGDESHRCLAVYRDDALQRRIGEGDLYARGSAVIDDAVFVADLAAHCVSVYPRVGGVRVRRFGARGSGPNEIRDPTGLAACGGRVYVATARRVSVFAGDGAFIAHAGGNDGSFIFGVAADGHEVFVTRADGGVRVLRADTLSPERLIGSELARGAVGVCVSGGVLFVADSTPPRVLAFDVVSGDFVASLGGFETDVEDPRGLAVRADGTLFVTTVGIPNRESRLYAAQLL